MALSRRIILRSATDCVNRTFSQLAADNQHAPLGLLLLGILAHVHAALSPLSPESSTSPGYPSLMMPSSSAPGASQRTKLMPSSLSISSPAPTTPATPASRMAEYGPDPSRKDYSRSTDRGVVISRDELAALRSQSDAQEAPPSPFTHEPAVAAPELDPAYQKVCSIQEEEQDRPSELSAPAQLPLKDNKTRSKHHDGDSIPRSSRKEDKSDKKKKKKKHGDALSSLFGSLA
jgi:ribonuclease MRP protein subunit RMP1